MTTTISMTTDTNTNIPADTATHAVVLQDQAGAWYLLTPGILAAAEATDRQRDELECRFGDGAKGFSIIAAEMRGRVPAQVVGVVPTPPCP